jgi:hypothetical protein
MISVSLQGYRAWISIAHLCPPFSDMIDVRTRWLTFPIFILQRIWPRLAEDRLGDPELGRVMLVTSAGWPGIHMSQMR